MAMFVSIRVDYKISTCLRYWIKYTRTTPPPPTKKQPTKLYGKALRKKFIQWALPKDQTRRSRTNGEIYVGTHLAAVCGTPQNRKETQKTGGSITYSTFSDIVNLHKDCSSFVGSLEVWSPLYQSKQVCHFTSEIYCWKIDNNVCWLY